MNRFVFTITKSIIVAALAMMATSTANAQYCTSGFYMFLGCTGDHCQSFSTSGGITNISNLNNGCGGNSQNYAYYSSMTHTAMPGSTVNFTITNNPSFSEQYKIWVDWNIDGDFLDPGEEVYNGGFRSGGVTFAGSFAVPATATPGQTRMRLRTGYGGLTGACSQADFGEVEDYNLLVMSSNPDVAVPGGIASPVNFCEGTFPVSVIIRNNGNNVINSVAIDWELDGTPMGTINYTTPIPIISATPGANEAVVTLGNVSFVSPNLSHQIEVTVTLPNGNTNNAPTGANVATYDLGAGLSGIYTVGGTGANFPDVVDAANYLNNFGICGPVTMNINPGTYTGRVRLNDIWGSSTTNRITFQSATGNALDVVITDATASAAASFYVFSLNGASDITLKNLSIAGTGTSGSGAVIELVDDISRDSVLGCRLSISSNGSSWNSYNIYGDAMEGANNVFIDNILVGADYGIYLYADIWNGLYVENTIIRNNEVLDAFSESVYCYYLDELEFNDNVIKTTAIAGNFLYPYHSGLVLNSCTDVEIKRNTIQINNGGSGMQLWGTYNSTRKDVMNNEIAVGGTATGDGFGLYDDGGYNINYYNNSIHVSSVSANAAAAYFSFVEDLTIRNNVFANTGGGLSMYMSSTSFPDVVCDYNNLHASGNTLVESGSTKYDSLSAWRGASAYDRNSISYDPGFTGQFDLRPDPTNAAAWSLNGRGIHIAGNSVDKAGNSRITVRADGVPDIGAYEFTPAVLPPLADASPAIPVPGMTQVFTFGHDTVARIHWDAAVPAPGSVAVRQYTGTVPPQFPVTNYMYFYTDIDVIRATYDLDADIYYKDPWLGKIAGEADLKITKKETPNAPWVAYNDQVQTSHQTLNKLSASTFTSLGYFTGIEADSLFSAYIRPASTTVFCTGGSVTLHANSDVGYTYQWKHNNAPIPGANQSWYLATLAGNYAVEVTSGAKAAQSMEVEITIVQNPNAHIRLHGPERICVGSSIMLSTPSSAGFHYQWQYNGNDIPGANSPAYTASAGGNYTVVVKNIGCANLSDPVVISQGPLELYLGSDTSFCVQEALVLDAANTGARYLWSTGDTTRTITAASVSGTYWVRVDAGPNCQAYDTIEVHVSPNPELVGISYIKAGNTYEFKPSGASNVDNYLWIFGDGSTDTSRIIRHEYTGGNYDLKLVVFNACGSDTAFLRLPLTIAEQSGASGALLYPNPANTEITFVLQDRSMSISDILVVNTLGQVVFKDMEVNALKQTIDISALPPGQYVLKAITSSGSAISRPFQVLR